MESGTIPDTLEHFSHDTTGIDEILDSMTVIKRIVIEAIVLHPETFKDKYMRGELFPFDSDCQRRMNEDRLCCRKSGICMSPLTSRYFVCHSCRLLSNFFYGKSDIFEKPICTEFGKYHEHPLWLRKGPVKIHFDEFVCDDVQCRISSDAFTNEILVSWMLEEALRGSGMDNLIQSLIYAFVCQNVRYQIFEYPDFGRLDQITSPKEEALHFTARHVARLPLSIEMSDGIFLQMVTLLHYLNQFLFVHLSPCSKMLLFQNQNVEYDYHNIKVKSPITLKLTHLMKSSLTLNTANKTLNLRSLILDKTPRFFVPHAEIKDGWFYMKDREVITEMETTGQNLIGNSWNAYTMMIVLMGDVAFYESFRTSVFYPAWLSMWKPEEIGLVELDMDSFRKRSDPFSDPENVYAILYQRHIKQGWIDETMSALGYS